MSSLARQQQALLDALFQRPADNAAKNIANYVTNSWARGLKAYQSNGHALAQRALAAAYPVLAQLLGVDTFADLAVAFWHAHPPQRGDVAQWGEALPLFVAQSTSLADEPYLPDVARVEWLLHQAASAPDAAPDLPSLGGLGSADPDHITLTLCPGTAVLASVYPVASIVLAHVTGEPTLQEAGRRLRDGVAEQALVWRQGFKPMLREALPGEMPLVAALQTGQSLAAALDAAPALDFNHWLPLAARTGLLTGLAALLPISR